MAIIVDNDTKLVVQGLTGTNEEIALKILSEAGITAMTDMDEAVMRAVELATGAAQ